MFPDFIIDEGTGKPETETDKPRYEEDKLSKYIARNIRVEVMPDIKGAVRISWNLHKDSVDDYIVGRSAVITDNINKALQAISIKVVPAGAKTEVIDSNLKPGTYYYCVLARSKVMDKEIELYAGQNYTINPAVIEPEIVQEPDKIFPQQVSLIFIRAINKNQVRISWRGIETQGIIYTIYRGENPLDTPDKIKNARQIQSIADDRESYTDSAFDKSGTYYYAITTRDIYGNEDLNLIPDQSYSTAGVYISLAVPAPVSNISARHVDEGISITWDKTSADASEYLVYRYTSPISDSEKLSLASYIGGVPADSTSFVDKKPVSGNYYYAVLTKFMDGIVLNDLIRGDNYTSEPFVLETGRNIELLSFNAARSDNGIELIWKISGNSGNRNYTIFRKGSRIKNQTDLSDAEEIGNIDVFDQKFFDSNILPGKYYYAIVPESADYIRIRAGVNATRKAVIVEGKTGQEKAVARPKVEKLPPVIVPKEKTYKKQAVSPGVSDVDLIIKKYFLPAKYRHAVRELQNIVKNSDSSFDKTKAKLFIGRAFVELKDYKRALRYFILRDVNELFPREARFWREYTLARISANNEENLIIKDNNNN